MLNLYSFPDSHLAILAISVRRFIASVLVIAYRTMAADALAAALNFAAASSAEFSAWVTAENANANAGGSGNAWAVDAAGTVRLPSVDENQVPGRVGEIAQRAPLERQCIAANQTFVLTQ